VPTSTAQTAQESNKQGEQPPPTPNNLLPTMQREQKVNYGPYAQECIHGYVGQRIYIFSYNQMSFRPRWLSLFQEGESETVSIRREEGKKAIKMG